MIQEITLSQKFERDLIYLVIIPSGKKDKTSNTESLENHKRKKVRTKLLKCKLAIADFLTRKNNEIDKKVENFNISGSMVVTTSGDVSDTTSVWIKEAKPEKI